jgi:uncharacterized Zn finger protein
MFYDWKPYVPMSVRRQEAVRELQRLKKKGQSVSPVVIEGRKIAQSFWGKAWCDNLERYSDYANRLPRGRTYVRNGSVVDLQVAPGEVSAVVSGSTLYKVAVKVAPVDRAQWTSICVDSAGAIDSLVELLQGRFSKGVMERLCEPKTGLFPAPTEIQLSCSCPDWASMCKHVAAVLYGIGARLDQQPELLFKLRKVDEGELIAQAGRGIPLSKAKPSAGRILGGEGLSELFGLELDAPVEAEAAKAVSDRRGSARGAPQAKAKQATATGKAPKAKRTQGARPAVKSGTRVGTSSKAATGATPKRVKQPRGSPRKSDASAL